MRFAQSALLAILGFTSFEASALADSPSPGNVVVEARPGQQPPRRKGKKVRRPQQQQQQQQQQYQWQEGHWERRGDQYVWIEGRWVAIGYAETPRYPSEAPPPAPVETVTPVVGYVWIDGHYDWQNGGYAWIAGHWETDQIGKRWQPGYWAQQANGTYGWVDGYWVDVPVPALPPRPQPRRGYQWIDGTYVWQSGAYVWQEGHWERTQRPPRRGRRW